MLRNLFFRGPHPLLTIQWPSTFTSSTKVISLDDLCIEEGKSAWALRLDLVCLSYDGSVADAALVAAGE